MIKRSKQKLSPSPRLIEILGTMDLPSLRTDATEPLHVMWLLRNMRFKNARHPDYREALDFLKALRREIARQPCNCRKK